jgi:hypothetical protein
VVQRERSRLRGAKMSAAGHVVQRERSRSRGAKINIRNQVMGKHASTHPEPS